MSDNANAFRVDRRNAAGRALKRFRGGPLWGAVWFNVVSTNRADASGHGPGGILLVLTARP